MIQIGEKTWELLRTYALEVGVIALRNAAERSIAEDAVGENEWRKVMVRADVMAAILSPLKQKPADDQVTGVWECPEEWLD
jgi:hypothetical protein